MFEKQWVYWFGFGFPFAATQYYFKGIGSSIFFVVFPLLVILSLDPNGVGWEVEPVESRIAKINFPIFSLALKAKQYVLRNK